MGSAKNDEIKSSADIVKDKVAASADADADTAKEPQKKDETAAESTPSPEERSDTPRLKIDFKMYIIMMGALGMQQLGKIKNPVSDAVEKDLIAAKHTIDLLALLEEKTAGNLTDDEDHVLKSTVTNLRLNYVDEMKSENGKEQ